MNIKKIVIVFILFNFLGLTLHFFPNLAIPLHSDLTWFYRMQTTEDEAVVVAIPAGMREIGAYPKSFWQACRDWWRYSGRFNCGDVLGQRLTAKFAGASADLWRITNIILLSTTMGFFYLLLRELGVASIVAILISLALFFQPIGIWTNYKSAEPRAIFFLILGFLLLLKSNKIWASYLSALAILAAALTKETFVLTWVLAPAFVLFRDKKILLVGLFPHFLVLGLFIAFYLYLRLFYPVWTSGYVFSRSVASQSIFDFALNILRMAPAYFKDVRFLLLFLVFVLVTLRLKFRDVLAKTLNVFGESRFKFLILSFAAAILLAALPYLVTGREIVDRYQVPGVFFTSLLVAVFVMPIYKYVFKNNGAWHKVVFVFLILFFIYGQLRFILARSYQDRIDQTVWLRLIEEVARFAPRDSHVVLNFDEPYMVETAYSLEANTLFLGRRDLTYHLIIDNESYGKREDFVRTTVELFNKDRRPIPEEQTGNVLYVNADRKGGVDYKPYLNYRISLKK